MRIITAAAFFHFTGKREYKEERVSRAARNGAAGPFSICHKCIPGGKK